MNIRKAVLTAAAPGQQTLPLQNLVDADGLPKSVLRVLLDQTFAAGVEQVAVVVAPDSASNYASAAGELAGRVQFVEQAEPLGYAHALWQARDFVGEDAFLHLVGDHLFVPAAGQAADVTELCRVAAREEVCVSAVQPTREHQLVQFGAVGGVRVAGERRLYEMQRVLEKPTPTQAEQVLHVPGLRSGHYLCFYGMHVWTGSLMPALAARFGAVLDPREVDLTAVLDELVGRERYLALEMRGRRFDLGQRYGLLAAQIAIGLHGADADLVLDTVTDVLLQRERDRLRDAARAAERVPAENAPAENGPAASDSAEADA